MNSLKGICILLFITTMMVACKKKYPEDSAIPHFYSPYKRIVGNWSLKASEIKIGNYSPNGTVEKCSFYSDGICSGGSSSINFSGSTNFSVSYNFSFSGWWELMENKNKIRIHNKYTNNHYTDFEIRRLDRNNMILENDSVRLEFKEYQGH